MKYFNISIPALLMAAIVLSACGPSEEEQQQTEQARQDSLEQVRQDSLEQMRQDSLAKVQQDSMQTTRQGQTAVPADINFTENGQFTIQVESWRSREKAQAQAQTWKDRGFGNAFVVKHGNEEIGDVWFRVRLGRVETRQEAKQLQQTLQEEYQAQSWIVTSRE